MPPTPATPPSPPIRPSEVAGALELGARELISIVGGGGKTTTLFSLGASLDGRVVMTTTTKMGSERDDGFAVALDPTDTALAAALDEHGRVLVWRDRGDHRADGIEPEVCDRWFGTGIADHVVVEADGSRRRPFKAPEAWEPVVPSSTTTLVVCIGAVALGQPIEQVCFRVDRVTEIAECMPADRLTPARAASVLTSPAGSLKGRPRHTRVAVLIHGVPAGSDPLVDELTERLASVELDDGSMLSTLPISPASPAG